MLLNPKLVLGAAIAALAAAVIFIAFLGPNIINDVTKEGPGKISSPINIIPITVELHDISVVSLTDKEAQIQVDFKVTNSNYKSVILQMIKYELYQNGKRIVTGQIGERPEGAIAGSNYFTILKDKPQIIGEKIIIKNAGTDPELWQSLADNNVQWQLKGEAYYNLSSMTAGQENTVTFDLTK